MSDQAQWAQLILSVQEKGKAFNSTPLLTRAFEEPVVGSHPGTTPKSDRIRIMQWNLLAQGLCLTSDGFILCPPEALSWDYRQHHILEEILHYQADIYCLEEVDHFSYIQEHLSKLNFEGLFCPKPDSPCLYEDNNMGPDGCAIFWRQDLFKLLSHECVVLQKNSGRNTNQVSLLCRFEVLTGESKGKDFVVAVTHLKSKKGHENLRLEQGSFLEKYLRKVANGSPAILCGDFNAEPEEQVVKVMKDSQIGFCSAYTLLSPESHEPAFTTWKVRGGKNGKGLDESAHTIDYLFFTTKHFQCSALLRFPTKEEMGPGFLPSFAYPSDHLSLVVDLKLL